MKSSMLELQSAMGNEISPRTKSFVAKILGLYSPLLPELTIRIISKGTLGSARNRSYANPARPTENQPVLRVQYKTRNAKLATVEKTVLLGSWNEGDTRKKLDLLAKEHLRREATVLKFDPVALTILKQYTQKDEATLKSEIMSFTKNEKIKGLFCKEQPRRTQKIKTGPLSGNGYEYKTGCTGPNLTQIKIAINRGNVHVDLSVNGLKLFTSEKLIQMPKALPQSILSAMSGRPLSDVIDAPWTQGIIIAKAGNEIEGIVGSWIKYK